MKLTKLSARLIKKKREKNKISIIRNEKGEVTTDNEEIQRIIADYYYQLNSKKMDKTGSRLNQEEIEITNNPNTSTKIETVMKNLPKNKSPGPDGFTGEFYQMFREELMTILLKFFQNVAEEGNVQTHSMRPPSP